MNSERLPKITIGIPMYNVENYIEQTLLSALEQKFPYEYEILIVDDNSTDDSVRVINTIKGNHPKGSIITIIHSDTNQGVGTARETIIKKARGQYLFFLDSDDWMAENILTPMYNKMVESHADLVVSNVEYVYETHNWNPTNYHELVVEHEGAGAYAISHKIANIHQEWWGKLWDLDFLRKNKIYNQFRIIDDILPQFMMCALSHKIAWIPEISIYYRIRPNSITTGINHNQAKVDAVLAVYLNTISACRDLLKTSQYQLDGVYDMYLDRVRDAINNLAPFEFTDEQIKRIQIVLHDFISPIPSIKYLHNKHNKLVYVLCKHHSTFKDAVFAYTIAPNKLFGRVLRNILNCC